MSPSRLAGVAWSTCVVTTGAALGAALVAGQADLAQSQGRLADVLVVATTSAVGAMLLTLRPTEAAGRFLVLGAAGWGVGSLVLEVATSRLVIDPSPPWAAAALAALVVRGAGWVTLVVQLPLAVPGASARTRGASAVRRVGAASGGLFLVATVLASDLRFDNRLAGVDNPLGVPASGDGAVDVLALVGFAGLLVPIAAGIGTAVIRWRRGDPLTRQRVGWLAAPAVLSVVAVAAVPVGGDTALLFPLAVAALPVALAVGLLQERLYDIPLLLNRTVLYVGLTAAVLVTYVLVVVGVGALVGVRGAAWLPLLAAAVVAVAFSPVRESLQRAATRLTHGSWDDPGLVLAELGGRLAAAANRGHLLEEATATVARSLRIPYLAVVGPDGTALAEHGRPGATAPATLPLLCGGVPTGHLVVDRPRSRAGDDDLLAAVAAQLAPVVRAQLLGDEVRRSREALVLAREEERRRLRRDLHDGLGPALAGLALKADMVRNGIPADHPAQRSLLDLRGEAQEAVADVRRMVEDLRPPALDDLGLGGALQAWARRAAAQVPVGVDVTCGDLLPAAVEVAAYRIAQEAVANVAAHSGARSCELVIRREAAGVIVEVRDDGSGPTGARHGGNGLTTMRERAEELGGTLETTRREGGGTTVRAVLPLPVELPSARSPDPGPTHGSAV